MAIINSLVRKHARDNKIYTSALIKLVGPHCIKSVIGKNPRQQALRLAVKFLTGEISPTWNSQDTSLASGLIHGNRKK